jgi:hypothetical protein
LATSVVEALVGALAEALVAPLGGGWMGVSME